MARRRNGQGERKGAVVIANKAEACIEQIAPSLWIGHICALPRISSVHSNDSATVKWTVITVLAEDSLILLSQSLIDGVKSHGIQVSQIVWRLKDKVQSNLLSMDLTLILNEIDAAIRWSKHRCNIQSNSSDQHACLIHCAKGVSRSAAVCAAWLISRKGMSLSQAMDTIRQARPLANPNIGFLASLWALERCGGCVESARQRLCSRCGSTATA